MDTLELTQEWDKTFPKSDQINHSKVTFENRYGITLAADLYLPRQAQGKLAAIAVCGPYGAVKEQCSGLYAQTMAERGFITLAFDPSFSGESGGQPRYVSSPDINTEDYSAAVDYLTLRDDVDPERIGILGICGWGGWQKITDLPFLTFPLMAYADEIKSAVLVVHGEKAYSLPASQEAFKKLKGDNKELMIIPGATHVDLYDRRDVIPFDKFEEFFNKYLP